MKKSWIACHLYKLDPRLVVLWKSEHDGQEEKKVVYLIFYHMGSWNLKSLWGRQLKEWRKTRVTTYSLVAWLMKECIVQELLKNGCKESLTEEGMRTRWCNGRYKQISKTGLKGSECWVNTGWHSFFLSRKSLPEWKSWHPEVMIIGRFGTRIFGAGNK